MVLWSDSQPLLLSDRAPAEHGAVFLHRRAMLGSYTGSFTGTGAFPGKAITASVARVRRFRYDLRGPNFLAIGVPDGLRRQRRNALSSSS